MPRRKSASSHSSRKIPAYLVHSADAKQRAELKAHGYRTTSKGVAIDGPRDKRRDRISGARMDIEKKGVVKWSVGQRREYIVGFTAKEKKEFAKNPEAFTALKLQEVIARHPRTFKKIRRPPQVRLQWGAYGATKDFSVPQLIKSYKHFQREGAWIPKKTREAKDRLVGLRIIIHIPKRRKKK